MRSCTHPASARWCGSPTPTPRTWRRVFDTNVIGAAIVTSAAIEHLTASGGTAAYLSSVSASLTPPWPGLGAYAVSKAALDKLVEAWRAEHPTVGFTRVVVGDCARRRERRAVAVRHELGHRPRGRTLSRSGWSATISPVRSSTSNTSSRSSTRCCGAARRSRFRASRSRRVRSQTDAAHLGSYVRFRKRSTLARRSAVSNDSLSAAIAKSIVASTARSTCRLSTRLVASTA